MRVLEDAPDDDEAMMMINQEGFLISLCQGLIFYVNSGVIWMGVLRRLDREKDSEEVDLCYIVIQAFLLYPFTWDPFALSTAGLLLSCQDYNWVSFLPALLWSRSFIFVSQEFIHQESNLYFLTPALGTCNPSRSYLFICLFLLLQLGSTTGNANNISFLLNEGMILQGDEEEERNIVPFMQNGWPV